MILTLHKFIIMGLLVGTSAARNLKGAENIPEECTPLLASNLVALCRNFIELGCLLEDAPAACKGIADAYSEQTNGEHIDDFFVSELIGSTLAFHQLFDSLVFPTAANHYQEGDEEM